MTEKQRKALEAGSSPFTPENGAERQALSAAKRLENKKGKELAQAILDAIIKGEEAKKIQEELGVSENITREAIMHYKQASLASRTDMPGSTNAYKAVLTAAGRYEEKQSVSIDELPERMKPSDAIDYVAQMNK